LPIRSGRSVLACFGLQWPNFLIFATSGFGTKRTNRAG
jgi:hypothetical protein